jgi:hypothetical protein
MHKDVLERGEYMAMSEEERKKARRISSTKYANKNKEKVKECKRISQKRQQDKRNEQQRVRRAEDPRKYEVYNIVAKAVKLGAIESSPCTECGEEKVDAHHVDYSKPLDVIWLCKQHHLKVHTEHRVYA